MPTLRQQYEKLPVSVLKNTLYSGKLSPEEAKLCKEVLEEKTGQAVQIPQVDKRKKNQDNSEHHNVTAAKTVSTESIITDVRVVDIEMSFVSMVKFMVKWAVAAIPALFILVIAGVIGMAIFGGVLGSML